MQRRIMSSQVLQACLPRFVPFSIQFLRRSISSNLLKPVLTLFFTSQKEPLAYCMIIGHPRVTLPANH